MMRTIVLIFALITQVLESLYTGSKTSTYELCGRKLLYILRKPQLQPTQVMKNSDIFIPPEVGTEIYLGSIISLVPIVWATYEFNSRIQTQRKCLLCNGSGLVSVTRSGNSLSRPRKCWSCGGFLPWLGWKKFFFSTFFDVGNGGVLQRPATDYDQINADIKSGKLNQEDDDVNSHLEINKDQLSDSTEK